MKLEKNCTVKNDCWWFLFKRNTTIRSCFLIATVRIFNCVGTMATAFYNQTTLFYNKTSGLSFAFIPRNGASKRSVVPATERHRVIATRWSSLRSNSTRYYHRRVIFENDFENSLLLWRFLGLFIVCLAAVTIQISVVGLLSGLSLSSTPLKERVECYISGLLGLQFYRDCRA